MSSLILFWVMLSSFLSSLSFVSASVAGKKLTCFVQSEKLALEWVQNHIKKDDHEVWYIEERDQLKNSESYLVRFIKAYKESKSWDGCVRVQMAKAACAKMQVVQVSCNK